MNIDFSAIDRAVEKVIAKHEALFKFEMVMQGIKRSELPYPANFAICSGSVAVIAAEYRSKISKINSSKIPDGSGVYLIEPRKYEGENIRALATKSIGENCRCEFVEMPEKNWACDEAIGMPVGYCIPY